MKVKYVIAYPFGGRNLSVDWYLSTRLIQVPTNCRTKEIFSRGKTLDDAQTSMVEDALKLEAEYILFIEDDTQPPPHAIGALGQALELSDDSVMACGGIYTTRVAPPEPIVYMESGMGSHWNWKIGDIFPCWAVGMGCTMVKTKLFRMMQKPWFKTCYTVDDIKENPDVFPDIVEELEEREKHPQSRCGDIGLTTDVYFFAKLRSLGFNILAHGGVLPVHWDMSTTPATPYWLPKGSPPLRDLETSGKEIGWTHLDISSNTPCWLPKGSTLVRGEKSTWKEIACQQP